jgi:spermidine/putrescine transport system permease protein
MLDIDKGLYKGKEKLVPTIKRSKFEKRSMLLSIGTPTIFLIIFYVVPICIMGMYSFWKIDDFGTLDPVWNLNQYKTFFNNPVYFQLMKKSLLMAAINCGICFSISYPLAYFIAKKAPVRIR